MTVCCLNTPKYYIGRPRPRPRGISPPSADDLGFLTVSSTDNIRQAASDAAVSALILITAGSQTHASKLSAMSSLLISTPNHVPPASNTHTYLSLGELLSTSHTVQHRRTATVNYTYISIAQQPCQISSLHY